MELAIQSLLRSTEQVRLTLNTNLVRDVDISGDGNVPEAMISGSADEARFIAIISHKDNWSGEDEGGVFVYKQHNSSDNNGLDLERVYEIDDTFTLNIAQSQRAPGDVARMSMHEAAPTGFMFSLSSGNSGEMHASKPPMFFTSDVASLRNFSKACNEIRNTYVTKQAVQVAALITEKFKWLEPYIAQSEAFNAFNTEPQDLRILNQPLHTRLSPASAGLPGDDPADLRLVRDDWIRTTSHKLSTTGHQTLKIRLGTFNVNDQMPSQDLSSWLQGKVPSEYGKTIPPVDELSPLPLDRILSGMSLESSASGDSATKSASTEEEEDMDPDLIVLGFQELDLSTEALIYSSTTVREDAWTAAAIASLGEKGGEYRKARWSLLIFWSVVTLCIQLASRQLVGTLMIILVKTSLSSCFSCIRTAAAGVGVLGVMGNKGGIAIQLTYTPPATEEHASPGPTTIAFVNTHLAAFDEQYEKRNSDFRELAKRLVLVGQHGDAEARYPSVFDADYLFWMGDLNYRLEVPDADIRAILSADYLAGRFEVLLKYDQLRLAKAQKKAFESFQEPAINFLPTYRFSPGVARDSLDYDIKRKPAWTDRILYMTSPSGLVESTSYIGHPHIRMSDHKPVSADYRIGVDLYDIESQKEDAKQLYKSVYSLDDPSAKRDLKILDNTMVDFGDIYYQRQSERTIDVKNTGKAPCVYRFVAADEDSSIFPDWLRAEPLHALLLPDETIRVKITVLVDNACAQRMNLAEKDVRATLILHTLLGKDHFLSVTGTYKYTCFSNNLSTLTRLPEPIRKVSSVDELLPVKEQINAPKEIMKLINQLMSDHADVEGLFMIPGDEDKVQTIRECLDTGDEFPYNKDETDPSVYLAFATTLLEFLDSLTEPVVPSSLHLRCGDMTSRDEAFELLDSFPPASVNVWISLTAYLHYICQCAPTQEKQVEKAKQIAILFAPVLLRDDPKIVSPPISILTKIGFLLYFIS